MLILVLAACGTEPEGDIAPEGDTEADTSLEDTGEPYVPGPLPDPLILIEGEGEGLTGGFGSLLTTTDVNADGLDDLLVVDPKLDGTEGGEGVGRSYVFLSPIEVGTTVDDAVLRFGAPSGNRSIARSFRMGDLDGDGFQDLGVWVYTEWDEGSTQLVFGGAEPVKVDVSPVYRAAGDLDGDGFSDALAPQFSGSGGVAVRWGAPRNDDGSWTGENGPRWYGVEDYAYLGSEIGTGDLDGDGLDELAMSAFHTRDGQGTVYLVQGGERQTGNLPADDADWTLEGDDERGIIGRDRLVFVDLTGDGALDLLVSAQVDLKSTLEVVPRGQAGVLSAVSTTSLVGGPTVGIPSVDTGDIDGDGQADLALSLYNYDPVEGHTAVWFGPLDPGVLALDQPDLVRVNEVVQTSALGDFDGDGRASLAIGEPQYVVDGGFIGAVLLLE
jgi:hypothetical protein